MKYLKACKSLKTSVKTLSKISKKIHKLHKFKKNILKKDKSNKFIGLTKIFFSLTFLTLSYIFFETNFIFTHKYTYSNVKIPDSFNNFKIVQVSDLHKHCFGFKQSWLINKIKKANPDIIVITGDITDTKPGSSKSLYTFIQKAVQCAPVYYVPGNHEADLSNERFTELIDFMKNCGVQFPDENGIKLTADATSDEYITLYGFRDAQFYNFDTSYINKLKPDTSGFNVLLSHRPDFLELYAATNVDLIFSGHTHGGQICLPFIGAVVVPDQGLFPKLTDGIHINNNTTMIISRGLGTSCIPVRTFCRAEIVSVELKCKDY